jgi:hypothetical protein
LTLLSQVFKHACLSINDKDQIDQSIQLRQTNAVIPSPKDPNSTEENAVALTAEFLRSSRFAEFLGKAVFASVARDKSR